MGVEEQDQILGRLTREEKEMRRQVAAIEAKLAEYCRGLQEASNKIGGSFSPPHNPVFSIETAVDSLSLIPDRSQIEPALSDLRASKARLADIQRHLSMMG